MDNQHDLLIKMDQKLDDALERLGTMERQLFLGNGQPSIKDRLKALEEQNAGGHPNCPFERAKNKIFWGVAAAVGTGILAVIWYPAYLLIRLVLNHVGIQTP